MSTLAGPASGTGGPTPPLISPTGVAADPTGNIYVADSGNHAIFRMTPEGIWSLWAGTPGQPGSQDGPAASAQFNGPNGLALDAQDCLYVADSGNNTIRKITRAGEVSTFAGAAGQHGWVDGQGVAARFWWPFGVVVDASGTVFVADTSNGILRKITPQGLVSTFVSNAYLDGNTFRVSDPHGLALDASGNLYVAYSRGNMIRKVTPAAVVTTLAGTGLRGVNDGPHGTFLAPVALAIDATGIVYVADPLNELIRAISPLGQVTTLAGQPRQSGSNDGAALAATFFHPSGLAMDGTGNLLVADTLNSAIRKIAF